MSANQRVPVESIGAAVFAYVVAASVEGAFIHFIRPSEWELAWVSDVVLAVAFGVAVYLWRHLLATRHELADHERADLVLQTQLSLAADIQQRLLPTIPPASDGFELAAALRSAGKIGGDLYDFVETAPGVWLILVADVSGKGIPAAMALGSLRLAFRAFARQGGEPADVVTQLSAIAYQQWLGSPYVSCIVCSFDLNAGTLTYTNAGHPPGILVGPMGTRSLTRGGLPAGLLPDARFDQERVELQSGDVCLLISDGVSEALDEDVRLERDLEALSAPGRVASAADMCQVVMARALAGPGPAGVEHWDDDRTVVVARIRGPHSGSVGPSPGLSAEERAIAEVAAR